jgi:hypothetical protein
MNEISFLGGGQDRSRGYVDVRFQSRDEQSHQVGRDIHLQCVVHGNVERPHEFTYTKDGRPLENSKLGEDFCFNKISVFLS